MARRPKNIVRSTRFAPTFESLEQRQLLTANVLADGFLDNINLNNPGDTHQLQLEVNSQESLTFAFDMSRSAAQGNSLDPGAISIQSVSGHTIAPISASNGSTSSTFLAELGPGSYEITVLADGGSTGSYDFSISLVGDLDGNGRVSSFEDSWTQAAVTQANGGMNGYTASYYSYLGIPIDQNLYDLDIDANRDGKINGYDYASVHSNLGNGSFSIELTNDSAAPVITADLANDTGSSDTDGISKDITIIGNIFDAAESDIISFQASIDGGTPVSLLGDIDGNGDFTLDLSRLEEIAGVSLDDGQSHVLSLTAEDEYGNASEQAYTVNFTLDTIAPDVPDTPDMTDASDLGESPTDDLTADTTPTFNITAEAGATVQLYSDVAGLIGEATANASGVATITATTLAGGSHTITAKAIDAAGNESVVSSGLVITVDDVNPSAPSTPDLDAASDSGDSNTDNLTSDTTPSFTITAEVGSTVRLYSDVDGLIGMATANGSGVATIIATALTEGDHSITAIATDVAGNASFPSSGLSITIDTIAPEAPGTPNLTDDSDSGDSNTDNLTSDTTPTFTITTEAGATVRLYSGGSTLIGEAVADNSGVATITATTLAEGTHTITAIATDAAGNEGTVSSGLSITIDTTAPVAPGTPDLDDASDLGYSNTDNLTADNTPTFTITAEAGSTVRLYSDVSGLIGEATADASGVATITATTLSDGTHAITAKATDVAGNEGVVSVGLSIEIDTALPTAPAHDLAAASDTGTLGDQFTSETTVTIEGTTDPNTKVEIIGTSMETVSDASGNFSFSGVALSFGENVIAIRATSESGAINDSTTTYIQNNAPTAAAIAAVTINENDGQMEVATLTDIFSDVNVANGDSLTYEIISSLPSWLSALTIQNGKVYATTEGELDGTSTIEIKATDSYGEFVTGSFDLTVMPENDLPGYSSLSPILNGKKDEVVTIDDISTHFADEETSSDALTITVDSATNGSAVIVNGKLTFTPDPGYHGNDATVVLNVTDTAYGSIPANAAQPLTLYFNIANQNYQVEAYDVTATAIDEDSVSNTLIDSSVAKDHASETALEDLAFELVGASNGVLTITGGTVEIVEESGSRYFRFTPDQDWNGTTSFDYKVTDEAQGSEGSTSDTATVTITVNPINDAPNAIVGSATTLEDTTVDIDLYGLVDDVETADADLIFNLGSAANGTVELIDGHIARFTPATNYNGSLASFTYTVEDKGDGTSGAITTGPVAVNIAVTPVNDTPVTAGASLETNEDESVTIDLRTLVSDFETDKDDLEFSVGGAVNGTVTLLADGYTAQFTPASNFNNTAGSASFSYTVKDEPDGSSAAITTDPVTISVSVTPVNDAPQASSDTFTTNEDTSVDIDLYDLVHDEETADADLVFTLGDATNGSVELIDGHIVRFTPSINHNGSADFEYSVQDTGDGSTSNAITEGPVTVNVSVTPVNDAPIATGGSLTTNEDTYVEIDLYGLVTDVETVDANLIFSLGGESNGSVELIDGHIARFTPAQDFNDGHNGSASFTYTVQDTGDGGTNNAITQGPITISVSVTAVNDAPVAVDDTQDPLQEVPLYQNTTLDVLANDYDPDIEAGESDTLTIDSASVTGTGKGSVSIVDNKLVYSPESGATEQYEVTISYTIKDSSGATSTAEIKLDVVPNAAPVAGDDTATVDENGSVNGNMLDGDTDADGDTLTVDGIDTTGTIGSVTWSSDGSFTYDLTGTTHFDSLSVGDTATDTFTYTVSDGHGGTDTGTVTITITGSNDGPVADDDADWVNENGAVNIDVLTGDLDPDTSDTLTITGYDATNTKGSVTLNQDGTFTYSLINSTAFDSLGAGDEATDTFTYTISDGHGGTSTATVTVKVEGTNDVPVGGDDTTATDNETAITIDVLDNDSDAETTLTMLTNVIDLQSTTGTSGKSDLGATITITENGVHYDPTTSATLLALTSNDEVTDKFTYKVTDGSATTAVITVEVKVVGVENNAPYVANEIDDITKDINDDQPSLDPTVIDLTTVFADADGHNLSFEVENSNENIITTEIIDGTKLKITYLDYALNQDRTPADIKITATETDSNDKLSVTEEFKVTVTPQPMEFYLVVRDTASDTTTATRTENLPESLSSLEVGDSYVVEIWLTHTYYTKDSTTTVGGYPIVVSSAQGDLEFDKTLSSASSVSTEGAFYYMQSEYEIDNTAGVVNDIEGVNYSHDDVGVYPYYSRLGYVVFNATAEGTQDFDFNVDFAEILSAGYDMNDQQIAVYGTSVDIVADPNTYAFGIGTTSWIPVTGEIGGETLRGQSDHEDANMNGRQINGVLNLKFDDYDDPHTMKVSSGTLDPGPQDGSALSPGIGGQSGSADANFGLETDFYEIAIRNVIFSFDSADIDLMEGVHFDAAEVNTTFSSGTLDYRSTTGSSYGSINLAEISSDKVTISSGGAGGDVYTYADCVSLTYTVTVDLSDTFSAGSYVSFALNVNGKYDSSAAIMGTVSAEAAPTDVAMTVVKNATATDENSEVAALPSSEEWLDEWDAYWVEVWVKTEEGSGVNSANVDIAYNGDYFTATEIEYSSAVLSDFTGDILTDGIVSGFGGTFDSSVGADGYVLLGRVKFESLADDGIELDVESFGAKSLDLGLELTVNEVTVEGVEQATVGVERAPATELWAMPYDINDDDVIDLYDLSKLLTHFRADVTESSSAMAQVLDFNNDATVDLRDLSYILSNFRATKESGVDICFPETFTQRWVGLGLDITGESTAGELLDSATAIWQSMLDTEEPIDIQLVVTDFGDSKQLASAEILAVDENGMPIAGRVTIDDDAAGLGWYCQIDGAPDAEMYDLYTVMLHEIGHTLGFVGSYDGFAANLEVVDGEVTFVGEDLSVSMDSAGNHVTGDDLSDDLMSSTLDPGVRKLPSDLDAQMILAAYEDAEGGASGFAAVSAPITAAVTAADATEVVTVATTDFNQIEETLVGDMTWDRLIATTSEETEESSETTAAPMVDVVLAYELNETPVVTVRSDSETEADEEWTIDFIDTIVDEEVADETVDSIFEGWDELL